MPFRLTGFDTPLGGISWEKTTSRKKRIEEMFFFLESRRLLYNPKYLEVASECATSAIEIRECFVTVIKGVDFTKADKIVLSSMVNGCNSFLDDLNKVRRIVPNASLYGNNGNLLYYALKKFRESIKVGIMYFEKEYKLEFNINIMRDMF
jgi:hypothetical protein